jgi:hypothetical protein
MDRTISISPGCVVAGLSIVVVCIALAAGGLWLAGEVAGSGPLAAPTGSPAVAIVNGEPITSQEMDQLVAVNVVMRSLEDGEPVELTPQQWQQARAELLNQAINNRLIVQAARQAGVVVPANQAEAEWLAWQRKYELTPSELDAELARVGVDRQVLLGWLQNALIANVFLRQYVAPNATPEEQEQLYQDWLAKQLQTAQVQTFQPAGN